MLELKHSSVQQLPRGERYLHSFVCMLQLPTRPRSVSADASAGQHLKAIQVISKDRVPYMRKVQPYLRRSESQRWPPEAALRNTGCRGQ